MKVLIIGGVAAGTKTAAKLKREDRSIEVTVITKDQDISYAGCGLPYYGGRIYREQGRAESSIRRRSIPGLQALKCALGKRRFALDADKKEVTVKDVQTGNTEVCSYDKLVLAVGRFSGRAPGQRKGTAGRIQDEDAGRCGGDAYICGDKRREESGCDRRRIYRP